jgi:hypothetical protein
MTFTSAATRELSDRIRRPPGSGSGSAFRGEAGAVPAHDARS